MNHTVSINKVAKLDRLVLDYSRKEKEKRQNNILDVQTISHVSKQMNDNSPFLIMLIHLILFLQITIVFSRISWEQCEKSANGIKLLNLTVNPDPIIAPGLISISFTIHTNQNLTNPIKTTLSLRKNILIGYFPVPCASIGSCVYDDLCTLCTQCNCSMEVGEHSFTLPITIESNSWVLSGSYQAQIDFKTSSGERLCIKITNISIKTRK
ncbi:hypothetical protein I4U23_025324 [Adineta vaga]|nr:hypothetical protein I4U23_025324 [Adineta vaga]